MQLKQNDLITVHGWIMVDKLEAGQYKVHSVSLYHGQPTYSFKKPKGKKVIVRHFAHVIDPWIKPADHPNENKITLDTNKKVNNH